MLCPGATGDDADDEVEMTVRFMTKEEEEWTRKGHSGRGRGQEGINIHNNHLLFDIFL